MNKLILREYSEKNFPVHLAFSIIMWYTIKSVLFSVKRFSEKYIIIFRDFAEIGDIS